MRLSNKSTFSLVCFILLMAFVALPVMAHDADDDTVGPHDTHPVKVAVPEVAATTTTPLVPEVPAHNHHPKVTSIKLKPDADDATTEKVRDNMVVVGAAPDTATDGIDANEFVLIVTFDRPVVEAATSTDQNAIVEDPAVIDDADALAILALADVTFDVRDKMNVLLDPQSAISIIDVKWMGDDYDKFEVIVSATAEGDAIPTGMEDDDNEKVNLRVNIGAGVVYSAQTTEPNLEAVGDITIPGGANLASMFYSFMLVKELPDAPDTTAPDFTVATEPAANSVLTASDTVTFTITATENLGTGNNALVEADVQGTKNVKTKTFIPVQNTMPQQYIVVVTPIDHTQPIVLTISANAVMDTATDPNGNAAKVIEFSPLDEVHPTVEITATESRKDVDGTPTTVITFKFDFTEELGSDLTNAAHKGGFTRDDIDASHSSFGRVLGEGEPVKDPDDPTIYRFEVVAASVGITKIRLKGGSVADVAGNVLINDQDGLYTPENIKPEITITGPSLLAQRKFVGNRITVAVRDDLGVKGGLVASEIVITDGTKTGFKYTDNTATFDVKPNVGAVRVKVTVNADSVMDNLNNGNAETSKWFNVGPVLEVPGKGHLVVVKDFARQATFTFLSDDTRPTTGEVNPVRPAILSAREIQISNWTEMPDLERMFDYTSGEGGGALVLKKAASQATLAKGAVGITEIMWAADLNRIGAVQDAEARFQWIELENLTNDPVNVHLYYLVGRETYGAPEGPSMTNEIDRVGNFYDGSLGNDRWDVGTKGQNGNSYTGVDFISMHRNLPDFGKNHNYANINGMSAGSWVKSSLIFLTKTARNGSGKEYWHRGTPGRRHVHGTDSVTKKETATSVPSDTVIFNEIANRSDERYEWIELRNVSTGPINLKNYAITYVTAVDNEVLFYAFPNNDNAKIAAGGVLLLVDTDPRDNFDHPLAVGYDVDRNPADQIDGIAGPNDDFKDAPRYKVTDFKAGGLPDDGKFVLILRTPEKSDGGGKPGKDYRNTKDKIVDIAGYDNDGLKKSNYPATTPADLNVTNLWPLINYAAPDLAHNQLAVDTVHSRQHDNPGLGGRSGVGWSHKDKKPEHAAFRDTGFSGIGYKRHVARSARHGGDPGYHKITKNKVTEISNRDVVTISEIMTSQGDRGYPQWVELFNSSKTEAVNLAADDGWRLVIENPDDPIGTINFKTKGSVKTILPNQTVLVVSGSARSAGSDFLAASTVFPATRTFNVYREVAAQFGMKNRSDSFLNPKAFHIKLIDGKGVLSDEIGNLDGKARTNDEAKWEYPSGMTEDGERTSLIRIYDDGVAREGVSMDVSNVKPLGEKGNGTKKNPDVVDKTYSWLHAVDTEAGASRFIRHTWYGDETDHGTPGTRLGQILPVSLSFFRPTLEDGKVVIRWTTESELDNAGFNILRSQDRNGEFTKVNDQLIQGKGTTAERSTYKWVDTSAKPGAVYYYQIEDVSFAGERNMLTTTKLKGLISAKNKLTTKWGELKEVQ